MTNPFSIDYSFQPNEKVLIINYGSQYAHLLVRRCRECNVYPCIIPFTVTVNVVEKIDPKGIILSGGPANAYNDAAPHIDSSIWDFAERKRIPILGVCYGMQDMHYQLRGEVGPATHGELGCTDIEIANAGESDALFQNIQRTTKVWMSHLDEVKKCAPGFKILASSSKCLIGAASNSERLLWSVQFHPEVTHSVDGKQIFSNFLHKICQISLQSYTMWHYAMDEIENVKKKVGEKRHVIGALSGGVDSLVAAVIIYKAIGKRFHPVTIDTGLLRKNEAQQSIDRIKRTLPDTEVTLYDASDKFLQALRGVTDPEEKRKNIGSAFIDAFTNAVNLLKKKAENPNVFDDAFLLQGTLMTDIIESAGLPGYATTKIKSHHNVGGLPVKMNMELIEPLKRFFKDEVRAIGSQLKLDEESIWRHPFPGPGLAVRIIGEVTQKRLDILREADNIFIEELKASDQYKKIAQAFAVLIPECRTVGIAGDERTYGMTLTLRAVESVDFMTADWYPLPTEILKKCATRITNEVPDINRVCYDVSSKPPATIEWE